MISWFYVWLPRFCGCHCRDDRSFHYHGRRFPVCARCTGELVGILAAALCYPWVRVSALWAAVLMIPMVLDGGVQALTPYESTNTRRFVTGLLFGCGLLTLFFFTTACALRWGVQIGDGLVPAP